MPRGAKMSLTLNEPQWLLFIQIQALPPSMHHKWKEITDIVSKKTDGIS
jgi:hypothetical protein